MELGYFRLKGLPTRDKFLPLGMCLHHGRRLKSNILLTKSLIISKLACYKRIFWSFKYLWKTERYGQFLNRLSSENIKETTSIRDSPMKISALKASNNHKKIYDTTYQKRATISAIILHFWIHFKFIPVPKLIESK